MKRLSLKQWITGIVLSSVLFISNLFAQAQQYPYTSGQAVFVQSPYASSLYTNYNYQPHNTAPHRLPSYTTNQAVFVQRPYATAQQTVTSYPSTYRYSFPRTENRYTSPSAYPATVAPAYPFANVGLYISSPYTTTTQSSTYHYPYREMDYTTTYTYPYTTSTETDPYPSPTLQHGSYAYPVSGPAVSYPPTNIQQLTPGYPATTTQGYPSTTYNAHPVATARRYPNPTTTTAVPETVVQPTTATPVRSRP